MQIHWVARWLELATLSRCLEMSGGWTRTFLGVENGDPALLVDRMRLISHWVDVGGVLHLIPGRGDGNRSLSQVPPRVPAPVLIPQGNP